MENLTNDQLAIAAGGGLLGMGIGMILAFSCIYYILIVIAAWKIFTKAGEKGWKSLIPVYRWYIFYKIAKVNFWVWWFIPMVLAVVISSLTGSNSNDPAVWVSIFVLAVCVYAIIGSAKFANGLAKSFGRGTGFAVGLFFLPNIFQLILGFGSSKYVEKK